MRFQEKTNEYINIGNNLSEEEQGRKCLKGLSDKFKSSIFQFMLSKDIPCNIKYFRQLCILADEYGGYSSKPGGEKELEANLVMPSASRTVEFKGKYGPGTATTPILKQPNSQVHHSGNSRIQRGSRRNGNTPEQKSQDKYYNKPSHTPDYRSNHKRSHSNNINSDQRPDKKRRWNNTDNSNQSQYNSTPNHGYSNQPVRNSNAQYQGSGQNNSYNHQNYEFRTLDELQQQRQSHSSQMPAPSNRNFSTPPIQVEGMTLSKLANGEFAWVIPQNYSERNNTPMRNNNNDNHLSANMICDYEKVINYGDFYSYSLYSLGSMLRLLAEKLSRYCIKHESHSSFYFLILII